MVLALIQRGRRVGITGPSHNVISNALDAVADLAEQTGESVRLFQLAPEGHRAHRHAVAQCGAAAAVMGKLAAASGVVGATAWPFASANLRGAVDTLFVDEAGQLSLAQVVAASRATRNLILLGDPNQLSQPSHGLHPKGADISALAHVLGGSQTIPPDRGVFLDLTWRMHPAICRFVSEMMYAEELHSRPECHRQSVGGKGWLSGAGLRYRPVEHAGNTTRSDEEAREVARAVRDLLGRPWTDVGGSTRRLGPADVLVVAPYNVQVAHLQPMLPAGVVAGTVDRFQGREAPVVLYSMATSSPDDVPHGIDFLYSRNRLNVAISRARGLAVLFCSPKLLDLHPQSIESMRLASALCRFVEVAQTG